MSSEATPVTASRPIPLWWVLAGLAALVPLFRMVAVSFGSRIDLVNHAVFKFWLAGRMILEGSSPYDSEAWLASHRAFQSVWLANDIFLYPPAVAYLMVPLGMLELSTAFVVWGTLLLLCVAATLFLVIRRWDVDHPVLLALALLVACFLYFPVLQALSNSTPGGIFLLALAAATVVEGRHAAFWRGLLAGVVLLKPSLGVPIVGVVGLWMLVRRDWAGVGGVVLAGVTIAAASFVHDLEWLAKLAAENLEQVGRVAAKQPTLFNASLAACGQAEGCGRFLAGGLWLLFFLRGVSLVVRHAQSLAPSAAISIAVCLTMLITPYVWPYDYLLLILPFLWITETMIRKGMTPVVPAAWWMIAITVMYATTPRVSANIHDYSKNYVVPVLTWIVLEAMLAVSRARRDRSGPAPG